MELEIIIICTIIAFVFFAAGYALCAFLSYNKCDSCNMEKFYHIVSDERTTDDN